MGLSDLIRRILEFFYALTGNYGIAIIFLTVLIRVVLFPLTWKQAKARDEMLRLQPKLKELQEKYKGKPQEYQKRIMELYREHKINPFGGCWPYLLQFPFIIALFNVLRTYKFADQRFLWLTSLSKPDPFYVLPILAGLTTFIQGKMMTTEPSQQAMNYIMPIFIIWISLGFPAGLTLYWVVTSVLAVVEQYVTGRQIATPAAVGKGLAPAKATARGENVKDEGRRKDR